MSHRRMAAALGIRLLRFGESHAVASTAQHAKFLPSLAHPVLHRQQGHSNGIREQFQLAGPQLRAYSQCSCPGMDALPSNRLFVEYQPEEVDRFIEVADAVEDAFPGLVVEGVEAVEGAHTFAIRMEDGTVIYAQAGHGSIPGNEELISHIRAAGAGEAK